MSETDDEITTEPPDPLAGSDDSVAKRGEELQEEVEEREGVGDAPNTEDR